MLNAPSLDFAHHFDPASRRSAPDRVAIRFESEAALERGLALAQGEPWVAECRVERATRTLHLRLCSGAAPERTTAPRLH
jgi:hypothetical protein